MKWNVGNCLLITTIFLAMIDRACVNMDDFTKEFFLLFNVISFKFISWQKINE